VALVTALLVSIPAAAEDNAPMSGAGPRSIAGQVYKSDSCQCCNKWIQHMQSKGFVLEGKDIPPSERTRLRAHLGIKAEHASCHTAMIDGYIVEGHVPAEAVLRLLTERPDAKGLAVPEMPAGSPGMEMADGSKEPYEVLLLKKDGSTEVYSRH
jgi:hypothetical protein